MPSAGPRKDGVVDRLPRSRFPTTDRMPRYKHIDTQPKLLPVDLARQLLPGTFEQALNYLLDHEIDLSSFDARFS